MAPHPIHASGTNHACGTPTRQAAAHENQQQNNHNVESTTYETNYLH